MLANILFFSFNFIFLICFFFYVRYKIDKHVINKDVINNIKKEVNSIILQLNKTTFDNISLADEKIKELDKKIILASKKDAGLKTNILKTSVQDLDLFKEIGDNSRNSNNQNQTYSIKTIKHMQNNSENQNKEKKLFEDSKDSIDEKIRNMSIIEKAGFLLENGYNFIDIQKKLKLSSGELELLINTQNIRKN